MSPLKIKHQKHKKKSIRRKIAPRDRWPNGKPGNQGKKKVSRPILLQAIRKFKARIPDIAKATGFSRVEINQLKRDDAQIQKAFVREERRERRRLLEVSSQRSVDYRNILNEKDISEVDRQLVYDLAKIFCKWEEISGILGLSPATLQRYCANEFRAGREHGIQSVRRAQYERAVDDKSDRMLEWMGMQEMHQHRYPKRDNGNGSPPVVDLSKLSDKELATMEEILSKTQSTPE